MLAPTLALVFLLQAPAAVQPGAVTGQVRTVDGVPAVNVRVIALAVPKFGTPEDALNYFSIGLPVQQTLTDNQGNYSLVDLPPDNYYIMAGAAGKGTYYPNSPIVKGAETIAVQSSLLVDSVNMQLSNRLGGKVSGHVNANMKELGLRTATLSGGQLEELLEAPVNAQGIFEFGHVPPGKYLLSLYPPTPGIASRPITLENSDLLGLELVPLPTKKVTGRIIIKNGGIPHGILGFYTEKTFVPGKIGPDGTFSIDLHSADHQIDFAGLPVGYSLASVKIGSEDRTRQGISVRNADVSDVLITVDAPKRLAIVKGQVSGLPQGLFASTPVELAGPSYSRLQADIEQSGAFEFPSVIPGLYKLTLKGIPELAPITIVVDGFGTFNVAVNVPSR